MSNTNEITATQLFFGIRNFIRYLVSKVLFIVLVSFIFAVLGVVYAWTRKPVYTAELTFAAENEQSSPIGAYAGMAAQFGLDILGKGNAFSGENLIHLMLSRKMVEKTMLTPVVLEGRRQLLINYYIEIRDLKKTLQKETKLQSIIFTGEPQPYSRSRDSIFKDICKKVVESIDFNRYEKKSDIISIKMKDTDELFAKTFVEQLVNNVIQYYTEYKVAKSRQNVSILQRQADSVKNLISGNIVDIAVSSDLNVNPTRQIVRTGIQRKQVDAQVNGALYSELVKNLELSKLNLRRETPLIQIIDTPMLPLEKKKMGRLKGAILFGIAGAFLSIIYLVGKMFLRDVKEKAKN